MDLHYNSLWRFTPNPNGLSIIQLIKDLIESSNIEIENRFYSLNINDIKFMLYRITQLPKSFIDLTYSLSNIRPQMMKLRLKLQSPVTKNKKDIRFSHTNNWFNFFGKPRPIMLRYAIPDWYNPNKMHIWCDKILKEKKIKKINKNFVDDKLIWLWECNMYTEPEMDFD